MKKLLKFIVPVLLVTLVFSLAACKKEKKETLILPGVSFSDTTYIYDGEEKTLTIEGTLPEGVSVSYTSNTMTKLGSKEVTATITGDSNHNETILKASLTIVSAEFILNENEYIMSECSENIMESL